MKTIINNEFPEKLNPLNDYLFYKVMGEKGDEVQLLGFLNAVFGRSGKKPIVSLEIMENTSFVKKIQDGKSCILDVLAVLQDGTKVNIEVQLGNQHNMDRRSLFYLGTVYTDGIKEGDNYRDLPNVVAVNIVDFNFPPRGGVHTSFRLHEDTDPSLILTEALEIHCINMVQWRKLKEKDIRNEPLHRWLTRFDRNSTPELIEEVANMDGAIMAANDKLNDVMRDEETRRTYWRCEMARMDMNGQLEYARDEGWGEGFGEGYNDGVKQGIERGIEQGIEQTSIEIARKMKNAGRPLAEIENFTGLSPVIIEKLQGSTD